MREIETPFSHTIKSLYHSVQVCLCLDFDFTGGMDVEDLVDQSFGLRNNVKTEDLVLGSITFILTKKPIME